MRFEMNDEQYARLIKACQPVPMIALQCGSPSSPQENANRAWQRLANEMGFIWDTVQPYSGQGPKVFTAEPQKDRNDAL